MNNVTILDGAMGTLLLAAGMNAGENPSLFGMNNPETITKIHLDYINAGSRVILTNTFSANADKLSGGSCTVSEVITANVAAAVAAKTAAEADGISGVSVALDIGPVGKLSEPYGTLSFDEAYDIFTEIIKAGEEAGADIIYFETLSSLAELRAGVLAAKENSSLPVWATMSFEESGKTFLGTTVASMAITLDALGVDAMGFNCSVGPKEFRVFTKEIKRFTKKPIIAKPNAGLPDPVTGKYGLDEQAFAAYMREVIAEGAAMVGGCCGTSPDYIRALAGAAFEETNSTNPEEPRSSDVLTCVCSSSKPLVFDGVFVVGERINPTGKKRLREALLENDMNYVMKLAIEQEEAGADILDINVGCPGIDEPDVMRRVVKAVQSVTDLPLQIDSSNPAAIESGLRACCGRAVVNSTDASDEKLAVVLPIAKKYGAALVGLTMDGTGIPRSADERVSLAAKIIKKASDYGISEDNIIIDCLTLTAAAQPDQIKETLEAVRRVRGELGAHCTLGISNVSFGLPEREKINRAFLAQALAFGVDFPIVNPCVEPIMDTVFASKLLLGQDSDCKNFIKRISETSLPEESGSVSRSENLTIKEAVSKGLSGEVATLVKDKLADTKELDIVNEYLIPALDEVGKQYESGKIFLPQLMTAANAACAGFDVIKESIINRGGKNVTRGDIILATVEGDIHDIGKNIVRVVLENYGFHVIDLGKDVPAGEIVRQAKEKNVRLIGLSALMTTTVPSMEKTIKMLRKSGCDCVVMVGGAVLTKEYAEKIGADFYTKDATASVRVAEKIFG